MFLSAGDFIDDKKHGRGTFTYHFGSSYRGDWIEDKKHGRGVFKYANGDCYTGPFVHGFMEGEGVFEFGNGVYNLMCRAPSFSPTAEHPL